MRRLDGLALTFVLGLALAAEIPLCQSRPVPRIEEVIARVRQSRQELPSIRGVATVETDRRPEAMPDSKRILAESWAAAGQYSWWLQGEDWQLVKRFVVPAADGSQFERVHVLKTLGDARLSYEAMGPKGKTLAMAYGRKETDTDPIGVAFPLHGRDKRQVEQLLLKLLSPNIRWNPTSAEEIVIEGVRVDSIGGHELRSPVVLILNTKKGYLATSMQLGPAGHATHVSIPELTLVEGSWFPAKVVISIDGAGTGTNSRGATTVVTYTDMEKSGPPSQGDVPPLPTSTVIGSEENVLYRVQADGSLAYWGQQGRRRVRSPLGWSALFVISGAVLLLGSLSWLILRKRALPS